MIFFLRINHALTLSYNRMYSTPRTVITDVLIKIFTSKSI